MNRSPEPREPTSARELFGLELRRLRRLRSLSQEELASIVVHSRTLIAAKDLAVRSDDALGANGAISRLWPLVEAERRAAREVLSGVRLSDLRAAVLRLAVLTGTDLSVLTVASPQAAPEGDV